MYTFCPMYHKIYNAGKYKHPREIENACIRSLFTWVMYNASNNLKNISRGDIVDKAISEFKNITLSNSRSIESIAHDVYNLINKIKVKVRDFDVVSCGLKYPFTVAASSIICDIDAILNQKDSKYIWVILMDFSDRVIPDEQILYLSNNIIPAKNLVTELNVPADQLKILIARVNSNKIITYKLKQHQLDKGLENIGNIVKSINERRTYKRISYYCKSCSFLKECNL